MKVVKVRTEENKERYYVSNNEGYPVEPILKFIRFKDNTGYARNTLKAYCYHLKSYFEYLEQRKLDFQEVTIDDLSLFVNWLQNPFKSLKVIPVNSLEKARSNRTINQMINSILIFYDYILRHEKYNNDISERLKRFIRTPSRNYKGFLYGIAYNNSQITSHVLKLKEPKQKPKTLNKNEISRIVKACNNKRDEFLINLLFETGLRIGEVLSLWIEDFDVTEQKLTLKDRGPLVNNSEIKTISSPRNIDVSADLLNFFMEYICKYHTSEVKTNHVFIKISGKNIYKPMDYININDLFITLRKKTKIYVTPHMFRHTSLTLLSESGWKPEYLRRRAGHKNIYTTINTYIHPSDEKIQKEFKQISSKFSLETLMDGE